MLLAAMAEGKHAVDPDAWAAAINPAVDGWVAATNLYPTQPNTHGQER
jgi:hypothetical protein